jgi:hypothetical protein
MTTATQAPAAPFDTRTFWRLVLAIAAPITPAAVAIARYLLPYNTNDAPAQIVAKTLAHPGFSTATQWLGLLLGAATIPGIIAVAWVLRRRAPVLTTVAVIICFLGFVPLFAGGIPTDLLNVVTSAKGLDRHTTEQIMLATDTDPTSAIGGITFVLGHIIGTILFGVAMLRTRVVAIPIAIGLIISQPIHFVAAVILGNHPLDLLGWGLTAIAFGAASLVLLRTPNNAFDLPPIQRR